jgi:molecular chaperone DnaK
MFNLTGIPPAPRGIPQVEVAFDIDANGILNVSAKDHGTGKEQKITITASTKLPKGDIDKMIREAEKNAEADKKRKEEVEVKNNADSLLYTTEKTMGEYGDKVTGEVKDSVEKAKTALKAALEGKDTADIKKKTEELSKAVQAVGMAVYQKAQAAQQQAGAQQGQQQAASEEPKKGPEENVVDAEYKVE